MANFGTILKEQRKSKGGNGTFDDHDDVQLGDEGRGGGGDALNLSQN